MEPPWCQSKEKVYEPKPFPLEFGFNKLSSKPWRGEEADRPRPRAYFTLRTCRCVFFPRIAYLSMRANFLVLAVVLSCTCRAQGRRSSVSRLMSTVPVLLWPTFPTGVHPAIIQGPRDPHNADSQNVGSGPQIIRIITTAEELSCSSVALIYDTGKWSLEVVTCARPRPVRGETKT
jgi:hypothetical protein